MGRSRDIYSVGFTFLFSCVESVLMPGQDKKRNLSVSVLLSNYKCFFLVFFFLVFFAEFMSG